MLEALNDNFCHTVKESVSDVIHVIWGWSKRAICERPQ